MLFIYKSQCLWYFNYPLLRFFSTHYHIFQLVLHVFYVGFQRNTDSYKFLIRICLCRLYLRFNTVFLPKNFRALELPIIYGMSLMYKRNRHGPTTGPWGTPDMTGQESDSSSSRTTRCVRICKKEPIMPTNDFSVYSKTPELQQQSTVVYLIKGLTEVHNNDVSLAFFIKGIRDVLNKLDQLSFTAEFTAETMLIWL